MEGHNSDSNNDSIPAGSVSSPEPVASTSASAASRAPAPTMQGILIPPSHRANTDLQFVITLPPSAAAMNEGSLALSPQQAASSPISETAKELELMQLTPFTPEELTWRPKQTKCPRTFVPDAKKDEKYYEKRLKNTQAVRVWRKRKDEMRTRMKVRLAYLESESARKKALIQHYETQRVLILAECEKLQQMINRLQEQISQTEIGTPPAAENKNQNSQAP